MKATSPDAPHPQLIVRPMDGGFAPGVARREILVRGTWTAAIFGSVPIPEVGDVRGITAPVILDCRESGSIDTTGAAVLADLLKDLGGLHEIRAADGEQRELLRRVLTIDTGRVRKPTQIGLIPFIGTQTIIIFRQLCSVISLFGEVVLVGTGALVSPRHFRGAELMTQLYSVCLMAIAVVSLVTFLIGVVVAYLFSLQAARYGANIFVVDGVGLAMLRELCPILVAVVVAGRTGSAFTAQIGAMRMNEELDALEMLGLSTYSVVVVPRVLALILAMPLLVFVGDCVGMAGAALIAQSFLGITPSFFFDRFLQVIPLKAYLIGVIKAPVFGLVVGLIACSMGLNVERNAQSLGMRTTSTVVQSIVAVIILNAVFAVVCATIGW
jgi:phospholipid/cholesterol/gamma-HCH transport system permease protein